MATGDLHVDLMSPKEIAKKLEQLDAVGKKAWRKVASKLIPPAVARAKAAAPQATGLLKRSITGKVTFHNNVRIFVNPKVFAAKSKGKWAKIALKGKSQKTSWNERKAALGKLRIPRYYAVPIEYGQYKKRKVKPKPFLLDVFRGQEQQILNRTVREFDIEMAKVAAK